MPRRNTRNQAEVVETPKRRKPTQSDSLEWGGFINLKLDVEQKAEFADWTQGDGAQSWSFLCDAVSEGLKYGLSYDTENQCFVATYTGQGVVSDERRYCLTARGSTMESATSLLVYKDRVMLEGDWGRYRPSNGSAEVE